MARRSVRVSAMDLLKSLRRAAPVSVLSGLLGPRGVSAVSRVVQDLRHVSDNVPEMESAQGRTRRSRIVKIERVPCGLSGETGLSAACLVVRGQLIESEHVAQEPGIWRTRVLGRTLSLTRVMQARVMAGVIGSNGLHVLLHVVLVGEIDRERVEH